MLPAKGSVWSLRAQGALMPPANLVLPGATLYQAIPVAHGVINIVVSVIVQPLLQLCLHRTSCSFLCLLGICVSVRCPYICSISGIGSLGMPGVVNSTSDVYMLTMACQINVWSFNLQGSACGRMLPNPLGVLTISCSGCLFFIVCFSLYLKLLLLYL